MPLTYADNWQVLASEVGRVLEALPFAAQFLECCALYCKKRAAAIYTRNQRVSAGHKRLLRARGNPVPGGVELSRLILSGVWAPCLHGAET
jgi:hypothetical protein